MSMAFRDRSMPNIIHNARRLRSSSRKQRLLAFKAMTLAVHPAHPTCSGSCKLAMPHPRSFCNFWLNRESDLIACKEGMDELTDRQPQVQERQQT
jgi:hypothetical protein